MITEMKKGFFLLILTCTLLRAYAQDVTYYKDIQPLIQKNCVPCHRPGEAGPFSLITYEDVAKRTKFIKKVVQSRYMPPWRANNHYVSFANDRSLKQSEIELITKWVDNNAPEGEPLKIAQAVIGPLPGTMYSRKPDLVLMAKDSFKVTGNNIERFVIFKIPFELKDSANIEAVEFYSNNKKLIHHANYAFHTVADPAIDIQHTDAFVNLTEGDRTKFDQYQPYRKSINYYGGWIPGSRYESYPKGFGWVLPKRGVILLTVHFTASPTDETSINGVNLFFTKAPVKRKVKVVSFGSGGIGERQIFPPLFIKANTVKTFTLEVTNPNEDQSIMYVWPHMHYIGKEFKAYVTTPASDTIRLVHIPEWDFRWQEIYRFKRLVKVPKGSVIHLECTYDNTENNPFNPNKPPSGIFSTSNMNATDEMMTLVMVFLPYEAGDEKVSLQ
jgi:hypothetical protein